MQQEVGAADAGDGAYLTSGKPDLSVKGASLTDEAQGTPSSELGRDSLGSAASLEHVELGVLGELEHSPEHAKEETPPGAEEIATPPKEETPRTPRGEARVEPEKVQPMQPAAGSIHSTSTFEITPASPAREKCGPAREEGGHEPQHPINVSVKEPEKVLTSSKLGIAGHYYSFPIRTNSTLSNFMADRMEVKRRFSDFDALHRILHRQFKGCFITPLPEKSFMESAINVAHEDFMRLRRADLQAYLHAIVSHPRLVSSEAVKLFLLQPGDLGRNPAWLNIVEPPHSAKLLARSTSSPLSASSSSSDRAPPQQPTPVANIADAAKTGMGSLMSWVRASIATVAPPLLKEVPEDEAYLRQAKVMLHDLRKLLELAGDSAKLVCQDMNKLCEDYREFGRTMGMLSRYEEAVQAQVGRYTEEGNGAAKRSADLQKVAMCSAKQCGIWRNNSVKSASNLVTLRDSLLLVPEAISALEERESALVHVQILESELERAKQQLSQAAAGSDKRAASLKQLVSSLEAQLALANDSYAEIKAANQSELARFGLEREGGFRTMLAAFATTQAGLVQASADTWANLARQYQEGSGNVAEGTSGLL